VVRTVTENCRTLKFENQGFEEATDTSRPVRRKQKMPSLRSYLTTAADVEFFHRTVEAAAKSFAWIPRRVWEVRSRFQDRAGERASSEWRLLNRSHHIASADFGIRVVGVRVC
jgi:hypothetical protein